MTKLTPLLKKIAFHQSIKAIKKKLKIKSKFLFKCVSTETIKRIIIGLDIKKHSSGEIPTYFFKKGDFDLGTITVFVNKVLQKQPPEVFCKKSCS